MANLQSLIQMAQAAQGGGGAPPAPAAGDPMMALKALLGQGSAMPSQGGGSSMLQALATAQAGSPRAMNIPGGGVPENRGAVGVGPGPMTDQGLTDMLDTQDAVRTDLPPSKRDGYTGSDSQEQILEDDPKRDDIGRPIGPRDQGRLQSNFSEDNRYRPNIGAEGAPGQAIMGSYLDRNKGAPSTEEELADINAKMGIPDPVQDGNFPSQKEIDDLLAGKIDSVQFDKKWGKGSATEMQDKAGNDDNDADDGDHEYR